MEHCFISAMESVDLPDASLPPQRLNLPAPVSSFMAGVWDDLINRDDLQRFARGLAVQRNAGNLAYDNVCLYLNLWDDEPLRVGHVARIDFAAPDPERDSLLHRPLPDLLIGYLHDRFGLPPGSTPVTWRVPD